MKFLGIVCLAVLSLAQADRDLSNIISLDINPFMRGMKPTVPKIVGGEEAKPNSFPYQAAIFVELPQGTAFCGGSILNENYILTAAHCVDSTKKVEVVLGAHNIRNEEPLQQRIVATEFIVHKGWSKLTLANDIALVKLPSKIQFNDAVQPTKLPCKSDEHKDLADLLATVSGWGKDSDKANGVSPVLRFVQSPILSQKACEKAYFGVTGDKHLCMSGKKGKSSCSGDSGGPLVADGVQHGLVSFGLAFGCSLGYPSAYTRVSSFLPWINENTGINICT